ncbi:MAG: flagellar hook-length control protein FliK [Burkholderiaceae bacterium]|nr:flagellar hook-length control protein FliK [Burkholderiaceae bacterium]
MDTTAIKTPAIVLTGTMAKASATDDATPDTGFGQVLSREMDDRSNANTTANQQTSDKTTDTTATRSAEETQSDDTTDTKHAENDTDATPLLVLVAELNAANGGNAASATSSDTTAKSQTNMTSDLPIGAKSVSASLTSAPESSNAEQNPAMKVVTTPESQSAEQTTSGQTAKVTRFSESAQQVGDAKTTDANLLKQSAELTSSAQNGIQLATASPTSSPITLKNLGNDALGSTRIDDLTTNAAIVAPMQQAVVNNTNAMGSHAEKLAPQVGTPDWNQALGQKVVWMLSNEVQSASLTLNPPDLGPLQVVLNVSNNQANASFVATQPEVRQALEAALPRLREMLGDAGIQLGQANVSAGTQQQHGSYGEQQQTTSGVQVVNESSFISTTGMTGNLRVAHQGLVDTFA